MVLTEHARRYLMAEGIAPETIIKTGSSMKQVLQAQAEHIHAPRVIEQLNLQPQEYFVLSIHREENVDSEKNFQILMKTLNAVANHYGKRIIVSTHPRTRKKLEQEQFQFSPLLEFMRPLSFADYSRLQMNVFCVISDGETITEESALLRRQPERNPFPQR